ncbi:MAG TPA: hypothetical protein VJA26_11605 [Gammaproteobacteria bacterium]|nr:hypothetical protein [Gammaproteobacteria bacterium]
MHRLDKTLSELIADNYRHTLRLPRDRDCRSAELVKRFAKANREQISRNAAREWLETVKAKRAPALPSNVLRFGEASKS